MAVLITDNVQPFRESAFERVAFALLKMEVSVSSLRCARRTLRRAFDAFANAGEQL